MTSERGTEAFFIQPLFTFLVTLTIFLLVELLDVKVLVGFLSYLQLLAEVLIGIIW